MNAPDIVPLQNVLVGAADPEIVALEARLRLAQLRADVDELDRLIAEELLFAGPDGRLASKAQDLEAHRSGLMRFRTHRPRELRIRAIGADVAVASLLTDLAVEVAGRTMAGTYRYTRIWQRDQAGWRVVAGQAAEVQQEPAAV